jgi:hypothetical protein
MKKRRIVPSGPIFRLPLRDFNCLELKDGIIIGLSEESDTISKFDVRRNINLEQKQICGLPPIVKYKWSNLRQSEVNFKFP